MLVNIRFCVIYYNSLALKTKPVYLLLIGRISQESVLNSSSNLLAVCVCGAMEADTAVHQRGLSNEPNSWVEGFWHSDGVSPGSSFNH